MTLTLSDIEAGIDSFTIPLGGSRIVIYEFPVSWDWTGCTLSGVLRKRRQPAAPPIFTFTSQGGSPTILTSGPDLSMSWSAALVMLMAGGEFYVDVRAVDPDGNPAIVLSITCTITPSTTGSP